MPKKPCSCRGCPSCAGLCPSLTEGGPCADCKPAVRAAYHDPERNRFYASAAWRKVRARYLQERPWCECGCLRPATDVHHKQDLKAGGAKFDWDNLEALAHGCHSSKTMKEVRSRA